MKIVAAAVVRNGEMFIETMIRSVSWVDTVAIYNDHSTDSTERIIEILRNDPIVPPIRIIPPMHEDTMMHYVASGERLIANEMRIRNAFIKLLFATYAPCVIILIDVDELMSLTLLPYIHTLITEERYNSIAISCTHLYDASQCIHVYPATWNGIAMIDPHVRIIKEYIPYESGDYPDVPDCFIRPSQLTLCLDIPAHIHLKYLKCLNRRTHALRCMSNDVTTFEHSDCLRPVRGSIPSDLQALVNQYLS